MYVVRSGRMANHPSGSSRITHRAVELGAAAQVVADRLAPVEPEA